MAELILPEPSEKQKLFLRDRHKYIGYGGARGGGKSWAVRVKAVLLCLRYPGIKVMIVRKTYPELQENHIIPLCEMLGCYLDGDEKIAEYNDGKKHIVFPNGSRILFRYLENEKDAMRFQGTEVDVLFVDEATQQSESRMEKLRACVRGTNDFPKRIYFTCNPGGEGHAWVKRLFIDRRFREGEEPEEHSFIQALITDNRALMEKNPDYIRQLESLPPKLRDAWLYGNWEIFEGQFFEDFRIEPDLKAALEHGCTLTREELKEQGRWCHVIAPFDLAAGPRRGWSIVRSYDFGYGKPFSCAWWAVDYEGVIYRILELYGCTGTPNEGLRWTPDRQFQEIARIEREHPWLRGRRIEGVADPAIWDASRGESVAETAAQVRGVLRAGGQQAHPRLDAVPLPPAVRRRGAQPHVCVRQLPGVSAHDPAFAVFQNRAGGSGHRAGGPRGGRVALSLHVKAGEAAQRSAEAGADGRSAEKVGATLAVARMQSICRTAAPGMSGNRNIVPPGDHEGRPYEEQAIGEEQQWTKT